jgi:hypothetical protein
MLTTKVNGTVLGLWSLQAELFFLIIMCVWLGAIGRELDPCLPRGLELEVRSYWGKGWGAWLCNYLCM